MSLNLLFVAVFVIQSVCQSLAAPATWAGDEDAPAQNPTPPDTTPVLTVNVSDNRVRIGVSDRQAAADLAKRIVDTAPGAFSESDQAAIRDAIEYIAASLPVITERGTHMLVMANRTKHLVAEIDYFVQKQASMTPEEQQTRAARILRILIELDLAAAATGFETHELRVSEARQLEQFDRRRSRLGGMRAATGFVGLLTGAIAALIPVGSVMTETFGPTSGLESDLVTMTKTSGWGFIGSALILITYGVIRHMDELLNSIPKNVDYARNARLPRTVYEQELKQATKKIATALRVTPIEGHPEIAVLALLTQATNLDARTLFKSACETLIGSPSVYSAVQIDYDPTPKPL